MSTAARGTGTDKTPGQLFALVFGAVYVLIGILGMFITTSVDETGTLIVFDVNLIHNIVHFAVGALLLVGSRTAAGAKTVNLIIGVVYLLLALLGFLEVGFLVDLLTEINLADNLLHLVTGAAALYFGTAGAGVGTTTARA
ncbi:MAG: DUF4383 domain-containing protein [Actinomycetota bacterium]|nr:DUF4383 domain-containing protein [Actinomycetota bacterium]